VISFPVEEDAKTGDLDGPSKKAIADFKEDRFKKL